MKIKYKIAYFFVTFSSYIALSLFEFLYLNNFLDIISSKYLVHVLGMIICLLVINPVVCYLIINKLPFKPDKRIKGGIKQEMKKPV